MTLMEQAIFVSCIVVLVSMSLILFRALRGPTRFDRILAVNALGTKTVMLLVLLGALSGRTGFIDIAIMYALVNFIATVAILKYVQLNRLG